LRTTLDRDDAVIGHNEVVPVEGVVQDEVDSRLGAGVR
jgi:hypothetical protein